MGYDPLAKIFYTTAITEMRHVDMLAKRVLFLKGDVEMRRKETVQKIHEPKEMIAHSKNLEQSAIDAYNKRVKELADNMDSATKKLIENIIVQEDGHWDDFDTGRGQLQELRRPNTSCFRPSSTARRPAKGEE